MSDPVITRLAGLPAAEPDIIRSDHIRRRCHAHLARHTRRSPITSRLTKAERLAPVWQSLIAVLGLGYLTQAIRFALDVYGLT
jgi:hypothetical protein